MVEDESDRVGQLGTFELLLSYFPAGSFPLVLPYRNSVEPILVEYQDDDDIWVPIVEFTARLGNLFPELVPDADWPVVFGPDRVRITFDAGYATEADVPEDFRQAILSIIGTLFHQGDEPNLGGAYQALSNRQFSRYL